MKKLTDLCCFNTIIVMLRNTLDLLYSESKVISFSYLLNKRVGKLCQR